MSEKRKKVNRRAATAAFLLLTENCNLRCTYCFEGGTRCVSNYMSSDTAHKAVDYLLAQAVECDVDEIKITFFGGEPMLCPELMTDIMHYAEARAKDAGKGTRYSIITNGTIYNDKIEAFLDVWRGYKGTIDVQLSIDGVPEIQNANRPCAAGNVLSSELAETAIAKYKAYCQRHSIDREKLHIHACVSKQSLPRINDSFLYFTRDLGIINSHFAWVIEDEWDDNDVLILSEQLQRIVKRLVDVTTNVKRYPFKHYDTPAGCSAGQNLISIDTQGNIYPCHRAFFSRGARGDNIILGNVADGITYSDRREQYIGIDYARISPEPCQICVATNQACTGSIYKMPNDYGAKFMTVINQYYQHFCDLLDKKTQVETLRRAAATIETLWARTQEQEERIRALETRAQSTL